MRFKYIMLSMTLIAAGTGCGVRGDPVPPGAPAVLGRGSPRYQDPARRMKAPPLPSAQEIKELEQQKEEEDKKAKDEAKK